MALKISLRQHDGIYCFDLCGRLVFGDEDQQLRQAVERQVQQGNARLVLNLARVTDIDNVGFGTLLCIREKLRSVGGDLVLTQLRPEHLDALAAAKLKIAFEVFSDDQDAVDRFFPDRLRRHYDILESIRSQNYPQQKRWSEGGSETGKSQTLKPL